MNTEYVINRLLQTVLIMFLVSVITFTFVSVLPGDPVVLLIGPENAATMTPQAIAQAREELGLNKPLPIRYGEWLGGVLTGDWGTSVRTRQSVLTSIRERAPVTIQLSVMAWVISTLIAIPAGVVAALRRNSWFDRSATLMSTVGVAVPNFWLGILVLLLFAVKLGWFPASGYVDPFEHPVQGLRTLFLPSMVLGLAQSATLMRQTRSSMLEVMSHDYIRTARAKGLTPYQVTVRHGLRNALLPIITILGLRLGNLIGGSVVIETVFALPGMGRLAVGGIFAQDFPVVMGVVLVIGLAVPMATFLTDIAYGIADPRIKVGRSAS
ncbi:MAG: ABC transporter permease [Dehalococcoidia bacterium]|nr:MAG: ABC transporter permease [Dehalococcoidia bacterium]